MQTSRMCLTKYRMNLIARLSLQCCEGGGRGIFFGFLTAWILTVGFPFLAVQTAWSRSNTDTTGHSALIAADQNPSTPRSPKSPLIPEPPELPPSPQDQQDPPVITPPVTDPEMTVPPPVLDSDIVVHPEPRHTDPEEHRKNESSPGAAP